MHGFFISLLVQQVELLIVSRIANVPRVQSKLRRGTMTFIVFACEDNKFRLKMIVVAVIINLSVQAWTKSKCLETLVSVHCMVDSAASLSALDSASLSVCVSVCVGFCQWLRQI